MQWFYTMDPLAERHYNVSPYAYVLNNPMRFIDPTGMLEDDPDDPQKEIPRPTREVLIEKVETILRGAISSAIDRVTNVVNTVVESVTNRDNLTSVGRTAGIVETMTTGVESATDLNLGSKVLGPATYVWSASIDAINTDFSNSKETGVFIENTVQSTIELIPIIGPAAGVMMDNAKQKDGLTNLSNGRMSGAFKSSNNQIQTYLQQHFPDKSQRK